MKLTLFGLERWLNQEKNTSLFENIKLPVSNLLEKETLVNTIILECGEFETLYADAEFMKFATENFFNKNYRTFEKWVEALAIEYSPLENYDRLEEEINSAATDTYSRVEGLRRTTSVEGKRTESYDDPNVTEVITPGKITTTHTATTEESTHTPGEINTTHTATTEENTHKEGTLTIKKQDGSITDNLGQTKSNTSKETTPGKLWNVALEQPIAVKEQLAGFSESGGLEDVRKTITDNTGKSNDTGNSVVPSISNSGTTITDGFGAFGGTIAAGSYYIPRETISGYNEKPKETSETTVNPVTNTKTFGEGTESHTHGDTTDSKTVTPGSTTVTEQVTSDTKTVTPGATEVEETATTREITHTPGVKTSEGYSDKPTTSETGHVAGQADTGTSTSGERKRTSRTHGNIGVTTSQQMLESELKIAQFNLYNEISRRYMLELTIPVYL